MPATPTIESLHAAWVDAFNKHDLDTHVSLYTEDAMLFGSIADLIVGREGIRRYFSGRGPNVHVRSYPLPRVVQITSDTAATAAHVDFADGDEPMPYRVTWMLVKRDGNWKIAQHHGSPRTPA